MIGFQYQHYFSGNLLLVHHYPCNHEIFHVDSILSCNLNANNDGYYIAGNYDCHEVCCTINDIYLVHQSDPMKTILFPTPTLLMLLLFPFVFSSVQADVMYRFDNIYEPSGLVQLADGRILIVVDEGKNPLLLYSIDKAKTGPELALLKRENSTIKVTDLEAVARGNNADVFMITSHSAMKNGKRKKKREQLLKLEFNKKQVVNVTMFGDLLSYLQTTLRSNLPLKADELETINIEGMAFNPEQQSLLIGLRSPVHDDKAIILTLLNPYDILEKNKSPVFDTSLQFVDLAGATIRGMTNDRKRNRYLITGEVANQKGKLRSRLWAWQPAVSTKPKQLTLPKMKSIQNIKNIEGITIAEHNNKEYLLFVCDDGKKTDKIGGHYGFINLEHLSIKQ